MNQLLSIIDDTLVIKKLSVATINGSVQATDDFKFDGNIFVNRDIKAKRNVEIAGMLTVDTLKVKNLYSESNTDTSSKTETTFLTKAEKDLEGKGLKWVDGETGTKQLIYKSGNILWSSMNIELNRQAFFKINNKRVLSENELGPSVVTSNLRKVGELEGLKATGQVEFDNWVFFNTNTNSIGVNTQTPSGTLGIIIDNGAEVVIGSKGDSTATIGTFTTSALDIITDNRSRMSFLTNGDIVAGNPKFGKSNFRIHGTLEVDEIITKSENQDKNLVTFRATSGAPYQTGLLWKHDANTKQFIYAANPDRLYSTEILDIANGKWFSIDGTMILSKSTLGDSVVNSNLEKVGILRTLEVTGESRFNSPITANDVNVENLKSKSILKISVDNEDELVIDANSNITIGNGDNLTRQVILNGKTTLRGSMGLNNKTIITGINPPESGEWKRGDICFNDEPSKEGWIGWVCVRSGKPGEWVSFGNIMAGYK